MLTADTSGLNSGLTRAQAAIKGFGMKVNAAGANNMLGMFAKGGSMAVGAAALGLSLAGIYRTLRLGISAGAEFEQAMTSSTDTLTGKTNALHEAWKGFTVTLTGPLRSGLTQIADSFAQVLDGLTQQLGGLTGKQMTAMMEARKKSLELAKQEKDAQEKAAKAAKEAHDRLMETMRERGASITESLRTPVEVFADTINELDELGRKGFIDPNIFARGIAKAKADLLDATKAAKEFKSATNVSVGAVERFSMAGFSAVQSGRTELIKIIEAEKQQLAESKKHTKLMEDGNELIRKRKPVILTRSNL